MVRLSEFISKNAANMSDEDLSIIAAGARMIEGYKKNILSEVDSGVRPMPRMSLDQYLHYCESGFVFIECNRRLQREKESGDLLVLLWDYVMPDYKFVQREVALGDAGRADILAEDSCGDRVVIELKNSDIYGEKSAPEQIARYCKKLQKLTGKPHTPMIINSTGIGSDYHSVLTWAELGIFNDHAYAPDSFDIANLADVCLAHNVYPKQIDGRLAYTYEVLFDYMYGGI